MTVGTAWQLYTQRCVYTTDIGEQRTIALVDGSSVELNARTKIKVRYSDQRRTIELLQGQALFRVAKDPNRPFIVDSNGTHVRAVGTQFDVYRKVDGTLVTVVEGRVAVIPASSEFLSHSEEPHLPTTRAPSAPLTPFRSAHAPNENIETLPHSLSALEERVAKPGEVSFGAGEQILIGQAAPAALKVANIEAATAWTQQRLIFNFTPLTDVAEEFNRYNRRPLVIDDPSLGTFNVSGSFSSTDPTLLLRFLREQPGIAVNETASEIRISRQAAGTG